MVKQESKMNSRNVENAMFFLSKFSGVQKAKFKPVDKNDLEKGWNVHINGGKVTFRISVDDKPEDICLKYLLASKHFDPYDMDYVSELSSKLVEYIVRNFTDYPLGELEVEQESGDFRYSDRVQDIFNTVYEIVDDEAQENENGDR